MESNEATLSSDFRQETVKLFYQRTHLSLWLGVVFFTLFSLLDYVYCREFFIQFLIYRHVLVAILLIMILSLRLGFFKKYVHLLMYTAMLLGTFTISLMIIELGGFTSCYYVGILLMIAGGFSVLPFTIKESLFTGVSMYLVYVVTIILGMSRIDNQAMIFAINNTFFIFTIVTVTTIQCSDESRTQMKAFRAKRNLKSLHNELAHFTDNLENMVKKRMQQLEETNLKFRDLFNNIPDLVVLINRDGSIQKVNQHCVLTLEQAADELQGKVLGSFISTTFRDSFSKTIQPRLIRGEDVEGIQLQMVTGNGRVIDVELYGNRVDIKDNGESYLLIIRDISKTKTIEKQVLESKQLLDTSRQAAIFGLARLAECRDDDTGTHLLRIREYTRILSEELANYNEFSHIITPAFIHDITMSSVLHDIGKVGIPDDILLKPEKLTDNEFEMMKRHCEYGGTTLSFAEQDSKSVTFLKMGQEISRYHHERWNGSGYPEGLSGTDIPLAARIVALADVYDALTSSRPYKQAYNHDQVTEMIIKENGNHFDPTIVKAFINKEQEFKETRLHLLLNR